MDIVSKITESGFPMTMESEGTDRKYELILGSLDQLRTMNKKEFIKKVFHDALRLIPEGEKGVFYELDGAYFVRVCSLGYDEASLAPKLLRTEALITDNRQIKPGLSDVCQVRSRIDASRRFNSVSRGMLISHSTKGLHTSLYAPIHVEGADVGLLCIDNFHDMPYSLLSQKTLRYFTRLIATYFEFRSSQEQVAQIRVELIQALISSIEVNDPYTEGHGRRVGFYARRMGDFLQLPATTSAELETAGMLHDIGKIGIPTEILNKTEPLEAEDYTIIRKHPGNTQKILHNIKGLSQISEIAYCHHEQYDGQGYPRGLKGNEIPLEGQILAIADAFDAMTTDRAYRHALTPSEAAEVILSQSGKQFSPELAKNGALLFPILYHMLHDGVVEEHEFASDLYKKLITP